MSDWSHAQLWLVYLASVAGLIVVIGLVAGLVKRYPAARWSKLAEAVQVALTLAAFAIPFAFGFLLAPAYAEQGDIATAIGVFLILPLVAMKITLYLSKMVELSMFLFLGGDLTAEASD